MKSASILSTGTKKISAIREFRRITGCDLKFILNFIECNNYRETNILLNGDQVARLLEATFGSCNGKKIIPSINLNMPENPLFEIRFIREIGASAFDFSKNEIP